MIYPWLKAAHVAAMATFAGGALMLAISGRTSNLVMHRVALNWNRRVTIPALLLAWMTGGVIAAQGQWFGDFWLSCKLALVVGLSALHAVLTGKIQYLSRAAVAEPPARIPPAQPPSLSPAMRWAAPAIVVVLCLIALLGVVKPA